MDYPSHPTHCREVIQARLPAAVWEMSPHFPLRERAAKIESLWMCTKFLVNSGVCEWLYLVQNIGPMNA